MINKSWLSRLFDVQHCSGKLKPENHKKKNQPLTKKKEKKKATCPLLENKLSRDKIKELLPSMLGETWLKEVIKWCLIMKRKGRVYWICTTHIKTYYTVKIWLLAEDITHREFNLFFKKQDGSSALKLTF